MCAISGIYYKNNTFLNHEVLKHFTDSMTHRGPDGAGYKILDEGHLGLGQRRLSILDLSEAGKQPMSYADGRYWITYNGEIFNFLEIRNELQALGHTFKSQTDTEVILAAYAQWGKACLDKFNGMWAFAIWDERDKTLFLARDRFGIKPLYYVHNPYRFFSFASETIAFKFLEGFKREIDLEKAKAIYQGAPFEGLGLTLFKDIHQILPGHFMIVTKDNLPKQKRWYDIREKIKIKNTESYEVNIEKFKSLFQDACKIRLRSDVPIASALSGGLDSSSVYSMVHHLSSGTAEKVRLPDNFRKAVTTTFPGTAMDEREYAQIVAEKWGVQNWVCVENKLSDPVVEIEKTTTLFDALSGAAMNSISAIYKGIKQEGITVSLDGHGVDEMLYGYRYTLDKLFYYYLNAKNWERVDAIKNTLINLYKEEDRISASKRFEKQIVSTKQHAKSLKGLIKGILTSNKQVDTLQYPSNCLELSDSIYDFSNFPFEEQVLLNDFFIGSLPTFLRDFDRAAMQHSVEVRMPFMDYQLVEFCFSLPFEHKLAMGFTKRILRDAMQGIVPKEIIERTYKVGISSPLQDWFQGELKEYMLDQLSKKDFDGYLEQFSMIKSKDYVKKIQSKTLSAKDATDIWFALNLKLIS